ncbi:MAG: HDIG domain-containing protein [Oscillospiraceae bacterium]|nr:HDIG domain-containing protein [Oscillospiraceae bacterium]
MNREEAYNMLKRNMAKPNLIKHCLAVEAVMRHFAELNNEDVEYWGNIGLLHDIDYEKYPEEHCEKCVEILQGENVSEEIIKSILSHGYGLCTDVMPEEFMEKVLITIDQLTGFIIACALIIPSKKLADVELASMLKKWKKKDFAAGTQRERIEHWTAELGYTLEYMLEETLAAMKKISNELGL